MRIRLLDGGTGQEIYRRSKLTEAPLWSVEAMLNEPEIVTQVHQDFIAAGSEVCTLNTYTATPTRLRSTNHEDDLELIHHLATKALNAAIKKTDQPIQIAGCLPPIHGSYLDAPNRTFDSLLAEYSQIVQLSPSVDLVANRNHDKSRRGRGGRECCRENGQTSVLAYRLEKKRKAQVGSDTDPGKRMLRS